jgi:hypothetical protein
LKSTSWKDIAELIGIAAIVASLIFVGLELRQTQSALMASTYQERAFDAMNASRDLADSEFIGPILARVDIDDEQSLDSLNSEELWRLRQYSVSRMIDLDNEYFQYQNGYLDEEFFEGQFKRSVLRNAKLWRAMGIFELRSDFSKLVDEVLAADAVE